MNLLTMELPFELRFQSLAYIAAAILFILALAGLSKQTTARRGNRSHAWHGPRTCCHSVDCHRACG